MTRYACVVALSVAGALAAACSRNAPDPPPSPDAVAVARPCLGAAADRTEVATGYLLLPEDEARAKAAREGLQVRVIGRDGRCLGRDDDRRLDRLNLITGRGRVLWAAVF